RALAVLDYALFRILKLLHPFMPFITEELAHRMGFVEEGRFLMYEEFPTCGSGRSDAAAAVAVDAKFELVRAGRFLRSSYNLPDGKKLNSISKLPTAPQRSSSKASWHHSRVCSMPKRWKFLPKHSMPPAAAPPQVRLSPAES
ncbi:MAG: class I tRNA ligase family protein, partial [Lentisphaeria bacterium]|nr:class I tRNA ligase family protein [Lentisphaeria bacterium]